MGRAPCCEKVGLKKGRWTEEEDDTLTKYIQANGEGSWRSLPKNAGLLRCGKSCRLRWVNYLRNDIKRGNISTQEDDTIIKLHASLGNKWSLIASQLPGRTDNEIKNYWNSHLSRKIDAFRRPNSEPLPMIMNLSTNASKKRGGRTSRAAMKKNKISYTTNNKIGKASPEIVKESGNLENNGVVPLPSTPTLEKETLPTSIIPWQEQEEKESRDIDMLSYQKVREGMLGSSELLGAHEGLESGLISFNDINNLLSSNEEGEKNETMVGGDQERESGVMSCLSKLATSDHDLESGNLCSNRESSGGEWLSCSSTSSYLENGGIDWEWEGLVHENLWNNEQEQEEMLSWLWDSDNGEGDTQNLGEGMQSEKQEALVAWLLS